MEHISIPYGTDKQTLHIPKERLLAVLCPAHGERPAQEDESAIVRQALDQPIASPRLREMAAGCRHILLITSDHTRPVPSRITLPLLLKEIRSGNQAAQITILIATGVHRATTEAELRDRFGDDIVNHERIVVHRADADEDMAFFGILPSGGELWLNKLIREADLVIAEGFVEPHFFAGFSGGRKSILPGVAARRTVLYNHNARFIQSDKARQGVLEDNPIHRDMMFAAGEAKLAFILNVLLDPDKRVTAAFSGNPREAHEAACALCKRVTQVRPVIADIVISSNGGYPLDQNIYQSVKGMTAAEACVRPGGAIILCAALGDGHGGEAFFRWFTDRPDAQSVTRDIEHVPPESTHMDQWEAQILARVMCKANCWLVTGGENRALVEAMHLRWAVDVNDALREASELLGYDAAVTVIPDGVGVIVEKDEAS